MTYLGEVFISEIRWNSIDMGSSEHGDGWAVEFLSVCVGVGYFLFGSLVMTVVLTLIGFGVGLTLAQELGIQGYDGLLVGALFGIPTGLLIPTAYSVSWRRGHNIYTVEIEKHIRTYLERTTSSNDSEAAHHSNEENTLSVAGTLLLVGALAPVLHIAFMATVSKPYAVYLSLLLLGVSIHILRNPNVQGLGQDTARIGESLGGALYVVPIYPALFLLTSRFVGPVDLWLTGALLLPYGALTTYCLLLFKDVEM